MRRQHVRDRGRIVHVDARQVARSARETPRSAATRPTRTGRPRRRDRAATPGTSWLMMVGCVTSSPTIATGHAAPSTLSAASGSPRMLASAAGVTLPSTPLRAERAAHDHHLLDERGDLRIVGERQREVRERTDGEQRDFAGMRAHRVDDEAVRGARVERRFAGGVEHDVAESVVAVNPRERLGRGAPERRGGAPRDRHARRRNARPGSARCASWCRSSRCRRRSSVRAVRCPDAAPERPAPSRRRRPGRCRR